MYTSTYTTISIVIYIYVIVINLLTIRLEYSKKKFFNRNNFFLGLDNYL